RVLLTSHPPPPSFAWRNPIGPRSQGATRRGGVRRGVPGGPAPPPPARYRGPPDASRPRLPPCRRRTAPSAPRPRSGQLGPCSPSLPSATAHRVEQETLPSYANGAGRPGIVEEDGAIGELPGAARARAGTP